ncbi:MAG TPA: hypothetical protein VHU23_01675 [Rhizomicrobium sp.]|jgi:hypothetical protein|nr:hypothetical protein [Rhizomicrobium sp.]
MVGIPDLENSFSAFEQDLALLEDGDELRQQLVRLAGEYLMARIQWAFYDASQRGSAGSNRTRAHDAFIAALNAFTRKAAAGGSSLGWRRTFSVNGEVEERKRIGDFACYIAFRAALQAR